MKTLLIPYGNLFVITLTRSREYKHVSQAFITWSIINMIKVSYVTQNKKLVALKKLIKKIDKISVYYCYYK